MNEGRKEKGKEKEWKNSGNGRGKEEIKGREGGKLVQRGGKNRRKVRVETEKKID